MIIRNMLIIFLTMMLFACDSQKPVNNENRCSFEDIGLPFVFVVYAVGESAGRIIDYQIKDRDDISTEVTVYVNDPDRPVALMLVGRSVNVWQIHRTPATKIVAVYAGNHDETRVLGLGAHVPVITTDYKDEVNNKSPCHSISWSYSTREEYKFSQVAQILFGKPVYQIFSENTNSQAFFEDRVFIGKPLPESSYVQDRVQPTESLRVPNTPLAGRAGLNEAVQNGLIRRATQEELQRYYESGAIPSHLFRTQFDQNGQLKYTPDRDAIYIIQKPFRFPAGLYGPYSTQFILEKGVPMPEGSMGRSKLISLDSQMCFMYSKPNDPYCYLSFVN